MKVIRNLEEYSSYPQPISLSIGNFDGVHKGHQALLTKLKQKGKQSVVFTFENHPSEILRPLNPSPQICLLKHKLKLLEETGIDVVILQNFTKDFSLQAPEAFLNQLREFVPFSYLLLGHDATLGRNKEGNRDRLQAFASHHHFEIEYLDPYLYNDVVISSSKIRESIQKGDLHQAKELLGRPYSIYGNVIKGMKQGRRLGFPTANISVSGLCLPPLGVYAVKVIHQGAPLLGVANLGVAPTLRHDNLPLLEVYLFMEPKEIYQEHLEVIFEQFIRPEMFFGTTEELKIQIQSDVSKAKAILKLE